MTHDNNLSVSTSTIFQTRANDSHCVKSVNKNKYLKQITNMSNDTVTPPSVGLLTRNKSDSHITHLNAQKNPSKLFLIKSYSFMDKSTKNHATKHTKLKTNQATQTNTNATKVADRKSKSLTGKSKSTKDKNLDHDLRALLRFPSVIKEGEVCETRTRRKSMPESTTPDPVEPTSPTKKSTFKRDSFFRHSLQSIRRSFRSHKKFTGFGQNVTNSNTSTTSTTSKSSACSSATSTASVTSADGRLPPNLLQHSSSNGSGKGGITILLNDNIVYRPAGEVGVCDSITDNSKSVSTFAATPNDSTSMAPLQSHTETQSVTTLNLYENADASSTPPNGSKSKATQQQHPQKQHQHHKRQSSNQSDYYTTATTDSSSARNSSTCGERRSLNSLVQSESTASIRSLSPTSRKRTSSSSWGGQTTAKHEQSSAAATTAAAAAAAVTAAIPAEKEKKRKEVSSSRVKKFHRHFTQVSKDEKLINYFSCALVSDILLQGHLYITDQHFAFYSNVFGYVTKVVIPTSSVTKISKEKTAKIIPNAVGVATADERHVFGSFISREAAFRLMCSVCPPLIPAEILPKTPAEIENFEEYSIEDDSSCSISGNESPPRALVAAAAATSAATSAIDELGQNLIHRNVQRSSASISDGHSDIPVDAKQTRAFSNTSTNASASPSARYNTNSGKTAIIDDATANGGGGGGGGTSSSNDGGLAVTGIALIVAGTASSTSGSSSPTASTTSSLPTTVMVNTPKSAAHAAMNSCKMLTQKALLRLKFPKELHVVYLGVLLTMVLALFSVFLLYRVLDIEAKTSAYRTPTEFNWRSGNDDDIFAEALRWQRELQTKSTEEAQNILTHNLEQIAKVRRSLETLSMLIHDRSSAFTNRDNRD